MSQTLADSSPGMDLRRNAVWVVLVATMVFALAIPERGLAQITIPVPAVVGDQLLFFFDARPGRVSFVTVANPSSSPVNVDAVAYGDGLTRVGSETREIPAAGNLVLDLREDLDRVADGRFGLLSITPISGDGRPIVPPEPLMGSFTLANTSLLSAFGENGLGRLAVVENGERAAPGTVVDGVASRYQRFTPESLMVPAYFDPQTLGNVDQDGNRIVLVAFLDRYGAVFDVTAAERTLPARFVGTNGAEHAATTAVVRGVLLTNLQELAGRTDLSGSGKLLLVADRNAAGNLFGVFSQSLGTFASGQRLPAF